MPGEYAVVKGKSMNTTMLCIWLLGSCITIGLSVPATAAQKLLGSEAKAIDYNNVDGQHGILRVKGALTDSPCRLQMESTDQTINLGIVGLGDLPNIGAVGQGATLRIGLTGCLAVQNAQWDRQIGLLPWSVNQPGVNIRFTGADTDSSGQYLQLRGGTGLGVVIKDIHGNPLKLGRFTSPQLLPVGQTELTYTVAPIRLQHMVSPGEFYGVMGFQLSYD